MTTLSLDHVSVSTKANVYFDGKCVSHTLTLADGSRKSVGVVLAACLTFDTAAAETMECVAGGCEYRMAARDAWVRQQPGDKFTVPANASFDIRVSEAYHYLCHYA